MEMMSSVTFPLFEGDKEIDQLWNENYTQTCRHPPRKNASQSAAPFCPLELLMAPPDQAHGSVPSSGLISIARNKDEGDGVEETEAEGKESNAAETNRMVVHKTSRNHPVSKSIMETLWATFKVKHRVRTPEAVRLAGDLAISVLQVKAWFRSTRRKHRKMAKGQRRVTKSKMQSVLRMKSSVICYMCCA
ncbi:NANOG neighbor homeobox-like [Ornithorhynchus anatinus]|uniref:NANOG neighbor homeobox-like n=1 Tax=Ornithorhynchus anatinus TaxID=9258 RepID=UPI0010A866BC|nr:NANOG neighbor homeobox-like [Ornithorhynchus anatinus]